jgi:DNA (cytosine-5)-methyltransferase 1
METLKDAISNLTSEQNQACAVFPEKRLKYYRLLKSGENWRNLPEELQKEAMGKSYYLGGGKQVF